MKKSAQARTIPIVSADRRDDLKGEPCGTRPDDWLVDPLPNAELAAVASNRNLSGPADSDRSRAPRTIFSPLQRGRARRFSLHAPLHSHRYVREFQSARPDARATRRAPLREWARKASGSWIADGRIGHTESRSAYCNPRTRRPAEPAASPQ